MYKTFEFLKSAAAIGAQTGAGTSDSVIDLQDYRDFVIQLNVSAAATDNGDLLKLYVQTSVDGSNWHDVGHFTDVVGDATEPVIRIMRFTTAAITTAEEAQQDAAVSSGTVRNGPIGNRLRLKWTITDAGADNASYTFTCVGAARG